MGAIKINGSTSGSTTITAPATGGDESIELSTVLDSKLPIAGGKVLQIVRATDSTNRTTTSTSYVDAGISVTITPQKSDSAVLLIWNADSAPTSNAAVQTQANVITDNSNNLVSAEAEFGVAVSNTSYYGWMNLIGYATPATTSAITYKGRFRAGSGVTARIRNATLGAGQLLAIEVSA